MRRDSHRESPDPATRDQLQNSGCQFAVPTLSDQARPRRRPNGRFESTSTPATGGNSYDAIGARVIAYPPRFPGLCRYRANLPIVNPRGLASRDGRGNPYGRRSRWTTSIGCHMTSRSGCRGYSSCSHVKSLETVLRSHNQNKRRRCSRFLIFRCVGGR